jgi:hypothetical protein
MPEYADEKLSFGAEGPSFQIMCEGLEGSAEEEDYLDPVAVFDATGWPNVRS